MTRYAPLWLQDETYPASVDRRLLGALWPGGGANGCAVSSAGSGMMLEVAPGSVAVPSSNNTGSVVCHSDAVENLTLDPAVHPPNQERCDLIICQARGADLDGGTDNDFVFAFVTGVPYAPPFDAVRDTPATPPGALALARANVVGGSAAIAPANITDVRPGALAVPPAWSQMGTPTVGVSPPVPPRLCTTSAVTAPTNSAGNVDFDIRSFGFVYGYNVVGLTSVDAGVGPIMFALNLAFCDLAKISLNIMYNGSTPFVAPCHMDVALLGA
jgi:hypothetical protein